MIRRTVRAGRQRGFSALESLVALAVLSLAMLPLLDLQSRSARAAASLERSADAITAEHSALALMEVLNPMRDPEGSERIGRYTLHWAAVPASNERPAYQSDGTPGRFVMRLYTVTYRLDGPGRQGRERQVTTIGWAATKPVLIGSSAATDASLRSEG